MCYKMCRKLLIKKSKTTNIRSKTTNFWFAIWKRWAIPTNCFWQLYLVSFWPILVGSNLTSNSSNFPISEFESFFGNIWYKKNKPWCEEWSLIKTCAEPHKAQPLSPSKSISYYSTVYKNTIIFPLIKKVRNHHFNFNLFYIPVIKIHHFRRNLGKA